MLGRFSSVLSAIEEQLGGILLFISVLLIVFQILLRAVLNYGLSGIYEIATFCVIWSVVLTAGLGIRRNLHVRVDVLMHMLPAKAAFCLEIVICVTLCLIGAALAYSGWLLVAESLHFGDATLGAIRIPMWIPQSIMPIGGFLIVFHAVGRLADLWSGDAPVLETHEVVPPSI